MNLSYFVFKRISLLFLLLHVTLFTRLRYSRGGTAAILGGSFVLESCADYFLIFQVTDPPAALLLRLAEIVIVQAGAWLVSDYRDMRAIFSGVSAAVYVLPGDFLCQLVPHSLEHSLLLALLVQILVHSLILYGTVKITRESWLSELRFKDTNWFLLSIIPVMFYLIMFSLCKPDLAVSTPREGNGLSVFLLLILTGTTNLVTMNLLSWKTRSMEKERDAAALRTCVDGMQRSIEVLQEKNEELLRVRHDSKHYNQMILSLLDESECEQAREAVRRRRRSGRCFSVKTSQRTRCSPRIPSGRRTRTCSSTAGRTSRCSSTSTITSWPRRSPIFWPTRCGQPARCRRHRRARSWSTSGLSRGC